MNEASSDAPSAASQRWHLALDRVKKDNDIVDEYSQALLETIQACPEFSFSTHSIEKDVGFQIPPLLSRHNLSVGWNRLQNCWTTNEQNQPEKIISILLAVGIFVLSSTISIISLQVALFTVSRYVVLGLVSILLFLLDWQHIQTLCPTILVKTCHGVHQVWKNYILQGEREQPSKYPSSSTMEHYQCIQFCHAMLQQQQQQEELSKSNMQSSDDEALSNVAEEASTNGSDQPAGDMAWIDVGAKIGMRLLKSSHMQRAVVAATEPEKNTTDASTEVGDSVSEISSKPVHSMWTSAAAHLASPVPSELESESEDGITPRSKPTSPLSPGRRHSRIRPRSQRQLEAAEHLKIPEMLSSTSPRPNLARRKRKSAITVALTQREPMVKGTKIAVPMSPHVPVLGVITEKRRNSRHYQMGTVIHSERIFVSGFPSSTNCDTNCLSVTVQLDRSFLRNAEFAKLTFRVLDCWSSRYMPKHSKVPIGSCVETTFGFGVLVGWRVQDDIHIVGSLWRKRGSGSARAYMNRKAILGIAKAAVGFHIQTRLGPGIVQAHVGGRFSVEIIGDNVHQSQVVELQPDEVLSCYGAQFMPILEHIREAASFQLQLDNYDAALRERQIMESDGESVGNVLLGEWSAWGEILWHSFLAAIEEDAGFDEGLDELMGNIISFLERLDGFEEHKIPSTPRIEPSYSLVDDEIECVVTPKSMAEVEDGREPGFWILNDMLGDVFNLKHSDGSEDQQSSTSAVSRSENDLAYEKIFGVVRILMKTVSISKATSSDRPHFRLALEIVYDFLLFVRTLVKVQRLNASAHSVEVWRRSLDEIWSTFGPIKERIEKIGMGIAERMEKQGRKAKVRTLNFVDSILGDSHMLFALEQGDWSTCARRLERSLVKSEVIQEEHRQYYRKAVRLFNEQLGGHIATAGGANDRNNAKLALIVALVQKLAAPRRSVLRIFQNELVLEIFERILVRVFEKEELASRMLTIHAANFSSLRHFRILKDFSTSGPLWIPLLDAADEEFSWVASHMSDGAKEFVCPLSSLFSLCVAQFHKIYAGNTATDWLDFLLEDDAVRIIHDIDLKLIQAIEAFARDVQETFSIVPYYATIDDDILKLVDEVDIDEFLKEGFEAIDDPEKLAAFVRHKTTVGMERFLNYLPKMSIPIEKRDLGDDWVLTCHGEDGGDLTLSDVNIKRENLVCRVIGSELLYLPNFDKGSPDPTPSKAISSTPKSLEVPVGCIEESILDHIRDMILEARHQGCWRRGVGGLVHPPTDPHVAAALKGLPVSSVLNCAFDLWRNLEIDDDELLEVAIRDVSYQIELHGQENVASDESSTVAQQNSGDSQWYEPSPVKAASTRFNPHIDPTVLFVEMKNLTLTLDNFSFRIEKNTPSIFDPVFLGRGTLSIHNIHIKLRVECAKERKARSKRGLDPNTEKFSPVLKLRELVVDLETIHLEVKDTGFGSDWILNRAVQVFQSSITQIVEENLKDQIKEQAKKAIVGLNTHFAANPSMLLNILGVSIDELEEHVVFV